MESNNRDIPNAENTGSSDVANYKIISKIAAAVAVASIIFFPVVGCGGANFNGIDIIGTDNIPGEIKVFLIASIICGIIIFFLKDFLYIMCSAIIGIVTLLISYLTARDRVGFLDLKAGAFLAIVGYGIAAALGFFKTFGKKNIEAGTTVTTSPYNEKRQAPDDTFVQIEKLNELREKGILTEQEFNDKKADLLSKL